jgi:hypothetical protein
VQSSKSLIYYSGTIGNVRGQNGDLAIEVEFELRQCQEIICEKERNLLSNSRLQYSVLQDILDLETRISYTSTFVSFQSTVRT